MTWVGVSCGRSPRGLPAVEAVGGQSGTLVGPTKPSDVKRGHQSKVLDEVGVAGEQNQDHVSLSRDSGHIRKTTHLKRLRKCACAKNIKKKKISSERTGGLRLVDSRLNSVSFTLAPLDRARPTEWECGGLEERQPTGSTNWRIWMIKGTTRGEIIPGSRRSHRERLQEECMPSCPACLSLSLWDSWLSQFIQKGAHLQRSPQYHRLDCVHNLYVKSQLPALQKGTLFGDRDFKTAIKS